MPSAKGHEHSKNGGGQAHSRETRKTARFSGHVTPLFDIKIAPLLQRATARLFPHSKSRSPHPSPRAPPLPHHPPCARPFAAKCERRGERRDWRTDSSRLPLGCNLLLGAIASCQRQEAPCMQDTRAIALAKKAHRHPSISPLLLCRGLFPLAVFRRRAAVAQCACHPCGLCECTTTLFGSDRDDAISISWAKMRAKLELH